jgi:hypothetical protein
MQPLSWRPSDPASGLPNTDNVPFSSVHANLQLPVDHDYVPCCGHLQFLGIIPLRSAHEAVSLRSGGRVLGPLQLVLHRQPNAPLSRQVPQSAAKRMSSRVEWIGTIWAQLHLLPHRAHVRRVFAYRTALLARLLEIIDPQPRATIRVRVHRGRQLFRPITDLPGLR